MRRWGTHEDHALALTDWDISSGLPAELIQVCKQNLKQSFSTKQQHISLNHKIYDSWLKLNSQGPVSSARCVFSYGQSHHSVMICQIQSHDFSLLCTCDFWGIYVNRFDIACECHLSAAAVNQPLLLFAQLQSKVTTDQFSSVTCIYEPNSQWAKFISSLLKPEWWLLDSTDVTLLALYIYFLFIYSAITLTVSFSIHIKEIYISWVQWSTL